MILYLKLNKGQVKLNSEEEEDKIILVVKVEV